MEFDDDAPVTVSGFAGPDPKELGMCRLEARIAAGRGSRVFRGVDLSAGRSVVVKVMHPPGLDDDDLGAPDRFLAAGTALAGAVLQNVVQVVRAGREGALTYVVFENIEGDDLDKIVHREKALIPAAAARAILDAAQGLAGALERGLVHGDVRPRHLLRTRGETKVTGFQLSPPYITAQNRRLKGHPAYLAPELAGSGVADHRADIYSLGCSLYELVTGRPPYGTGGADALVACHVHEQFPTIHSQGPRVPDELERFLERMTAKQPSKRFAGYTELLTAGASMLPALRRLVQQEPALVIEDGRQVGLRMLIPDGELLLGRTPGEGMQIDDARCSRRHAMLKRKGDHIEVTDLGSRNGIRVNGTDVSNSKQVFPGDRIEIGDTVLRIEGTLSGATLPGAGVVPASPVRGAFGDVEIVHPPQKQTGAEGLSEAGALGPALLVKLAPLLARSTPNLERDVIALAAEILGANQRAVVRVLNGAPVFEAATSSEAQILSCLLPAIERALPGQLALATAVKVGRDDRWGVAVAPIVKHGAISSVVALVKTQGRFDETSLAVLEACCALLSMRPG